MKVYKVTESGSPCTPLIIKDLISLEDEMGNIEYGEVGDKYEIEIIDMTKGEYENLPEWGGF